MSSPGRHATVASSDRSGGGREVRADIQALRAVAVSAVVLYHLWPNRLTGGFAGVDVFFVISGFLITSHLLAKPPTNPRNLLEFWSRRIRRLLPASLLVLLATLIASRIVAPETQWGSIASHVKAAAFYGVNWRLANDSVDYLAAQDAATPVQHFWSLSVEEQFYLVWPILILVLFLLAGRAVARRATVVTAGLSVVVAASLWYSISYTASHPDRAYFVTTTRIWELGIGGLLAALLARGAFGRTESRDAVPGPATVRVALAWAGLAAIAWTCFTYTGATPFPGWLALLPVLGATAVIAAKAPAGLFSPLRLFELRPVQWLGDVSYSVYLWHWPLIALVPNVSGDHLGRLDKATIIVASLVLAALTKWLVEDRFRTARWGRPIIKPYALGALGMAVVVAAALAQTGEVHHRQTQAKAALQAAVANHEHNPCFGAAALVTGPKVCPPVTSGKLALDPLAAASDRSDAHTGGKGHNCFSYSPSFALRTCERGDAHGAVRVALFGNSHAAEWLPALEKIAATQHWKITTYLISDCAAAEVPQTLDAPAATGNCLTWLHKAEKALHKGRYDLIVYANRAAVPAVGHDSIESSFHSYEMGYTTTLKNLATSGSRVVTIRDTPFPGKKIPDCLSNHSDDFSACDGPRSKWLPHDSAMNAVAALGDPHLTSVDLTSHICPGKTCHAVIGGVPAYFDQSHMTATFGATLAPYLQPSLVAALHGSPPPATKPK